MPINPKASHGENVKEVMHSFHKKGTIGASSPKSEKAAIAQANAIAYRAERDKKKKKRRRAFVKGAMGK